MEQAIKVRDLRERKHFIVDDIFLDKYAQKLGANPSMVYMVLCRYANFSSQSCFPSQITIAKAIHLSERSVRSGISTLNKWNIISIRKERGQSGKFLHNTYFLIDKTCWIAPEVMSSGGTPKAYFDNTQRHVVPYKDSYLDKDTDKEVTTIVETSPLITKEKKKKDDRVLALWSFFSERCKKLIGVSPIRDAKSIKIVQRALDHLSEKEIQQIFLEWFDSGKPNEEIIHITKALSTYQINTWKTFSALYR